MGLSFLVKISIGANEELFRSSEMAVSPVVMIRSDWDRMNFRITRSSSLVARSLSSSKTLGEIT